MKVKGDVWIDIGLAFLALSMAALLLSSCGEQRIPPPHKFRFSGGTAGIDALMIWMLTISILGIGASIALSSFVGKKIAGAGVAGFGSILVAALLVKAAIPFLPWVSLGMILIGSAFLIWYARKQMKAQDAVAAYACEVEGAVSDADVQELKARHALQQRMSGVKSIVEKSLTRVKATLEKKE